MTTLSFYGTKRIPWNIKKVKNFFFTLFVLLYNEWFVKKQGRDTTYKILFIMFTIKNVIENVYWDQLNPLSLNLSKLPNET